MSVLWALRLSLRACLQPCISHISSQSYLITPHHIFVHIATQDDLIERLGGPAEVAEMTGRQRRMVRGEGGKLRCVDAA